MLADQEKLDEILKTLNEAILPAIAGVKSDIRDGNTRRELLENKVIENTQEIRKHRDSLYGNGKVGIIRMIESIKEWVDSRKWYERILVVAITSETIALIFVILTK